MVRGRRGNPVYFLSSFFYNYHMHLNSKRKMIQFHRFHAINIVFFFWITMNFSHSLIHTLRYMYIFWSSAETFLHVSQNLKHWHEPVKVHCTVLYQYTSTNQYNWHTKHWQEPVQMAYKGKFKDNRTCNPPWPLE